MEKIFRRRDEGFNWPCAPEDDLSNGGGSLYLRGAEFEFYPARVLNFGFAAGTANFKPFRHSCRFGALVTGPKFPMQSACN